MGTALCKVFPLCQMVDTSLLARDEFGIYPRRKSSSISLASLSWRTNKGKSFRGRLMQKHPKNYDVYKKYQIVNVAGEGSISTVQVVKRKGPRKSWGRRLKKHPLRRPLSTNCVTENTEAQRKLVKRDLRRNDQKLYALKAIHKDEVNGLFLEEMRNEISILKHLDHPNIVRVYESFERKRKLFLVMEYCSGGDLYERIPYTEADAAKIVRNILSAMAYLHKNKVVHRDIKFENIMFENKTCDAGNVKLIDFGLSKKFRTGQKGTMRELVGTVYTMSPQVLQGVYTKQADIWAVGVVTYMLLSGSKPFSGTNREMIEKIMLCKYDFKGDSWKKITPEAKEFIKSLLKMDPSQRPTAEEALRDHWLSFPSSGSSGDFATSDATERPQQQRLKEINRSLVNYAKSTKLKKLALMVIAYRSSMEDILRLREAFRQYDTDCDGIITYADFQKALFDEYEYTEDELKSIFNGVDVNGTGVIDFTEFIAATLETQGRIENERLAEAFDRFDVDNSGYITKEDLWEVLGSQSCSEEMIAQILDEIDVDQSGRISYEMFLNIFRVKREEERNEAKYASPMHDENRQERKDALIPSLRSTGKYSLSQHDENLEGRNPFSPPSVNSISNYSLSMHDMHRQERKDAFLPSVTSIRKYSSMPDEHLQERHKAFPPHVDGIDHDNEDNRERYDVHIDSVGKHSSSMHEFNVHEKKDTFLPCVGSIRKYSSMTDEQRQERNESFAPTVTCNGQHSSLMPDVSLEKRDNALFPSVGSIREYSTSMQEMNLEERKNAFLPSSGSIRKYSSMHDEFPPGRNEAAVPRIRSISKHSSMNNEIPRAFNEAASGCGIHKYSSMHDELPQERSEVVLANVSSIGKHGENLPEENEAFPPSVSSVGMCSSSSQNNEQPVNRGGKYENIDKNTLHISSANLNLFNPIRRTIDRFKPQKFIFDKTLV